MARFHEYPISTSILDDDLLLFAQSTNQSVRTIKAKDLKAYVNSGVVTTPTLPNPLSGYVKWFRGDSVTLFGSEVAVFKDKYTSGNNLTPLSSNPLYLTDGINGKNVVRFTSRPMKTQPENYAAKTIYIVFRNNTNTFSDYNSYVCYRASSSNLTPISNETSIICGVANSNNIFGEGATAAYLDNVALNINNYSNYLIGVPIGAVGQFHLIENIKSTSTVGVKNLCVGVDSFSNARALVNSDIAEIIIYPTVLTTQERTTMNNYFKQMYNFSFL